MWPLLKLSVSTSSEQRFEILFTLCGNFTVILVDPNDLARAAVNKGSKSYLSLLKLHRHTRIDPNDLARAAVETSRLARSQAFEARIHKQPAASIHTTAALMAARINNTPTGDTKIFITVECRLKSSMKREQKTTSEDCGRWGKPWSKEDYLSGTVPHLFSEITLTTSYTEVLDDSLVTLNSHWSKLYGMGLER